MYALAVKETEAPKGIKRIVTSQWCAEAKRRQKALKLTQDDLGDLVGRSGGYISGLFNGRYETSREVDAINAILDMEQAATPAPASQEAAEVFKLVNQMSAEEIARLKKFLGLFGPK